MAPKSVNGLFFRANCGKIVYDVRRWQLLYLRKVSVLVFALALIICIPKIVSASCDPNQQSCSSNYGVSETYFGSGGELNACSSHYCSKQSAGELGVGNTSSTNYQAQAGFNTTDVPLLEVNVTGGVYDLGVLDSTTTKATSASFTVRNYLSDGYIVRLAGSSLKSPANGHTITAMASQASPSPGTEQFGVNLRLNSNPPGIGADPQQQPDTTFGFGTASTGYDTPDKYKYVDGDQIASSAKSSGVTLYTLSIIANISTNTPAGLYGTDLSVIVEPTF
jgi:hypothetical protein